MFFSIELALKQNKQHHTLGKDINLVKAWIKIASFKLGKALKMDCFNKQKWKLQNWRPKRILQRYIRKCYLWYVLELHVLKLYIFHTFKDGSRFAGSFALLEVLLSSNFYSTWTFTSLRFLLQLKTRFARTLASLEHSLGQNTRFARMLRKKKRQLIAKIRFIQTFFSIEVA